MFTICCSTISEGKLEEELKSMAQAEKKFNRDLGVLRRNFFQCIDQPHIIWTITEWISEQAHNSAARSIMKVRDDDRVASAFFQPGLYMEFFCKEFQNGAYIRDSQAVPELVVISHGVIASEKERNWYRRIEKATKTHSKKENLLRSRIFYDYYNRSHFWGLMEWNNRIGYEADRMISEITVEEFIFVGGCCSELAVYNQYYCAPLFLAEVNRNMV